MVTRTRANELSPMWACSLRLLALMFFRSSCVLLRRLLILALAAPAFALAQPCPEAGARLVTVRNAVNDIGKSGRAPAASDCALRWASSLTLDPEKLTDPDLVRFYIEASDLHRRAYEQRLRADLKPAADKYLNDEILLRRKFLEAALQSPDTGTNVELRKATVRHLSSLAGALALTQQFREIDKVLSKADAMVIDEAAVSVWLQALWSCAKFDGQTSNLCAPDNQRQCREKVSAFLSSVDDMKGRTFARQTVREIDKLRGLTGDGGCLK